MTDIKPQLDKPPGAAVVQFNQHPPDAPVPESPDRGLGGITDRFRRFFGRPEDEEPVPEGTVTRRTVLRAGLAAIILFAAGADEWPRPDLAPAEEDRTAVEALLDREEQRQRDPNRSKVDYTEMARSLGLTWNEESVHTPAINAIYDRLSSPDPEQTPTFDECLAVAEESLREFKVQIRLGDSSRFYTIPATKPSTPEELENDVAKGALMSLVTSLRILPKEYIELCGLEEMYLVTIAGESSAYVHTDILGIENAAYDSGAIFVDLLKMGNSAETWGQTAHHELFHLFDGKTKGVIGMHTDHDFAKLNPTGAYPLPDWNLSDEQYITALDKAAEQKYDTLADAQSAQEHLNQLAKRVTTATEYGRTGIADDKAEIGVRFPGTAASLGSVIDPRKPVLREKAVLLLSRLYRENPKLVEFLIAYNNLTPPSRTVITGDGHEFVFS